MRTLTIVCATLLLVSCGDKGKGVVHIHSDADSSPIIISDGSTEFKEAKNGRDNFTNKQPHKDEEIKATNYRPSAIGYKCDPSVDPVNSPETHPCPAPLPKTLCEPATTNPPTVSATAPCQVITDRAQKWDLYLCESAFPCADPGTVHLSWVKAGSDTVSMHSNDATDFTYTQASTAGAKVKHDSGIQLQGATLIVDGITYGFACAKHEACLIIGSNCLANGQCH